MPPVGQWLHVVQKFKSENVNSCPSVLLVYFSFIMSRLCTLGLEDLAVYIPTNFLHAILTSVCKTLVLHPLHMKRREGTPQFFFPGIDFNYQEFGLEASPAP